jgi:hypothetical protein
MKTKSLIIQDKRCPRCDERKHRDDFYDCHVSKTGLSSWCMECTREYQQEKREEYRAERVQRELASMGDTGGYDYVLCDELRRALGEIP